MHWPLKGSQGSSHKRIVSPLPTAQLRPFRSMSLPARTLLHLCEAVSGDGQSKKEQLRAYFPMRTRASRDCGSFISLQPIFASKASLKVSMSRNPRPPAYFGIAIVSHETQHIFFFSGLASHQNRVSNDCICLHKDIGSLKHDIAWHGIAERTDLSITCLPAPERNLAVQLWDFCLILSRIDANISRFRRPNCSGNPRYFPIPPSV